MPSVPLLGSLMATSFDFAPRGWALCHGQLLPINQNQALFSLVATRYGGNGTTTFALPDLRGRTPLGFAGDLPLGAAGGTETHSLSAAELPEHTHVVRVTEDRALTGSPSGAVFAAGPLAYAGGPSERFAAEAVTAIGGSQPHENRQPSLAIHWCIALVGVFPSPT